MDRRFCAILQNAFRAMTASEFLSVFHHVSIGSWDYSGILTDCMYMGKTIAVNNRALGCRIKGASRLAPTHHLRRYRAYTLFN